MGFVKGWFRAALERPRFRLGLAGDCQRDRSKSQRSLGIAGQPEGSLGIAEVLGDCRTAFDNSCRPTSHLSRLVAKNDTPKHT